MYPLIFVALCKLPGDFRIFSENLLHFRSTCNKIFYKSRKYFFSPSVHKSSLEQMRVNTVKVVNLLKKDFFSLPAFKNWLLRSVLREWKEESRLSKPLLAKQERKEGFLKWLGRGEC